MQNRSVALERAIEKHFPIGFVSQLAEHESWRKEIHRPIYYIHKWWARRLGSVFRAILLASCLGSEADVTQAFYSRAEFPETVVFDPFMGSGTIVGEAAKLGCRVIGRDINSVSYIMVKAALQEYSLGEVQAQYRRLEAEVGDAIRSFYRTVLPGGEQADVLYFFWVKTLPCPQCGQQVDLLRTRVFAAHAYPNRYPQAKAVCPDCGAINDVRYNDETATCSACSARYDPRIGNVRGNRVRCPSCGEEFNLLDIVRKQEEPPRHRMYAKLVLCQDGRKRYFPTDAGDLETFSRAAEMLPELWPIIPKEAIEEGYNTNQVLNYNYRYWHQMFNERQLVSLALLARSVSEIEDPNLRTLFSCLVSGCLEFNNMFASYKGEGTGAVRHMFAHHILKPELMPIEANVWGTPKSSGSFSTLFRTRIVRALQYKASPSELRLTSQGSRRSEAVVGLSRSLDRPVVGDFSTFEASKEAVYLSVGDSSETDLPDAAVDLVVTDPPFFDNVNYSELADFFYVWLRRMLKESHVTAAPTTRTVKEVQNGDPQEFSARLQGVLRECYRVLKPEGLLVFTYHHSRMEGWSALYLALRRAGFSICRTYPVKAEMAVAMPITQASDPINYDLIIVCSKASLKQPRPGTGVNLVGCVNETRIHLAHLQHFHLRVSHSDVRVMLMGSILSALSTIGDVEREYEMLRQTEAHLDQLVTAVFAGEQARLYPQFLAIDDTSHTRG